MISREINKVMVEYLDFHLEINGNAKDAIEKRDARRLFLYAAQACVGVREAKENNTGPVVELMQETIGRAERESWCMAFVQTCLAYVEQKMGVKSPIFASEHCLTVWNETPQVQRVRIRPLAGAIVIWQHGNTQNGHTGIVSEWRDHSFEAVEGNTERGKDLVRDGGGVYVTDRDIVGNGSLKIIGYLKPF